MMIMINMENDPNYMMLGLIFTLIGVIWTTLKSQINKLEISNEKRYNELNREREVHAREIQDLKNFNTKDVDYIKQELKEVRQDFAELKKFVYESIHNKSEEDNHHKGMVKAIYEHILNEKK